jgi:hypothetical protein
MLIDSMKRLTRLPVRSHVQSKALRFPYGGRFNLYRRGSCVSARDLARTHPSARAEDFYGKNGDVTANLSSTITYPTRSLLIAFF